MPHTVELTLRGTEPQHIKADLRHTSTTSVAPTTLTADMPVALATTALLALANAYDTAGYGRALSRQLFADQALREAWLQARAHAANLRLQQPHGVIQLNRETPMSIEEISAA